MDRRLLPIALLFLFASCERETKVTHFRGAAMTIPYHVQIGEKLSTCRQKKATKVINHTFNTVDETLNHWNPRSELSNINSLPVNVQVLISPHLRNVLKVAKQVHEISRGRFDPTYGLSISQWKGALLSKEFPEHVDMPGGFDAITIRGDILEKKKPLHLDLDGIAKGYSVDLLLEELSRAGFQNIYVNWGGEIRTTGNHPSGRPWQVLIGSNGHVTPLREKAAATSGNSIQYCEIDGVIYSHFIDPKTQKGIAQRRVQSVTVLAPTCALADALATTAMLFEDEDSLAEWASGLCSQNPSIQFIE